MGVGVQREISINDILNKGMLQAIRKRDILNARVLSSAERREQGISNGGPDVLCKSPSGVITMLKRSDIVTKYTYINGRAINMAAWASNRTYCIVMADNTPCRAMPIPKDCTVTVGNGRANAKERNRCDYVVAIVDESGDIIPETVGIISGVMFRKMYTIPSCSIIDRAVRRHKGLAPNIDSKPKVTLSKPDDTVKKQVISEEKPDVSNSGLDFGDDGLSVKPGTGFGTKNQTNNKSGVSAPVVDNRFKVEYRIVSEDGRLIGFGLKRGNSYKRVSLPQAAELMTKKMVSNVTLVTPKTGKKFFRRLDGNLSDIPIEPRR